MAGEVDIGTGTSVAFGTSGFTMQLIDVKPPNPKRKTIETSHMGTAAPAAGVVGNATFLPGDIVDGGEVTLSGHFNPSSLPPIHGAIETVTITYPVPAGLTNPATWVFSAMVTGFDPTVPLEDKMMVDVTLKVTGGVTKTAAS